MAPTEHVMPDPHAAAAYRYRAYCNDAELGLIDAAGPTPDTALERVRRRWRLRWLGVELVGMTRPVDARDPEAGQVASDGHRLALWRHVGPGERAMCWVLLNPSTADAGSDDATLRRCAGYAQAWGYGWLTVANLFTYRATSPAQLTAWVRAASSDSYQRWMATADRWALRMAERAEIVVVGWGAHGALEERGLDMLAKLGAVPHALAVTRDGHPCHPLRLEAGLTPRPLGELQMSAAAAA